MASDAWRRWRSRSESPSDTALPLALRRAVPASEERSVTCRPASAAQGRRGAFGENQKFGDGSLRWDTLRGRAALGPGLFAAQVVGESMNRRIPSSA